MSKKQLDEISNLLLAYSAGDYEYKGTISKKVDELDMIISGINMLGEELLATNVSRDFFSSIFNSVSDYVFICNLNGNIIDINQSACQNFGVDIKNAIRKPLSNFLAKSESKLFEKIKSGLKKHQPVFITETILQSKDNKKIYGQCSCAILLDRFEKFNGYLISIKDITEQKENEKTILRTIFTTQQKEQKRVADDLHDSLGAELAMAQLMIANLAKFRIKDENHKKLIETCTEILDSSVKHLREICFDLMPTALVKGGLSQGIAELILRLKKQDIIKVNFDNSTPLPRFDAEFEIALYRIIQEFVNNMLKHAKATEFTIVLKENKNKKNIRIDLQDNGVGFDLKKLKSLGENRGIMNIQTKVSAFGGTQKLTSQPNVGTRLTLTFPIKN